MVVGILVQFTAGHELKGLSLRDLPGPAGVPRTVSASSVRSILQFDFRSFVFVKL
jgi:hypothetical protein